MRSRMSGPPGKTNVLIIDDELQMRRLVHASLKRNGYEVLEAANGEQGISEAIHRLPNIIILDLGLPDIDGMEVLRRLREWSQVPVIVLSVRDRDTDKVKALDAGANDYLAKPFSTIELLARLRVIQRSHQPAATSSVFVSGQMQVDMVARSVKVRGQQLKLARTEYALLLYFVKNAGRVLTHGQLLREVWGLEEVERTARLRVYVTYLREKIEANPAKPELLITVPGVGYRLDVIE